jgi:histidinol-phosphatase (PHP family)
MCLFFILDDGYFMMGNILRNIDISVDGHIHTELCHHAKSGMEEYVVSAIHKGLQKIIFLEHLEMGIQYFESTWLSEKDFDFYFNEGERLRKKYSGALEIGLGVEVGYNPQKCNELIDFLEHYSWDRIGISYHFLEVDGQVVNVVSRQRTNIEAMDRIGIDRLVEKYYTNLKDAVQILPGTVLCHLDAVLRYHPRINALTINPDLVCDVLDAVVAKKMALEVNTSGFAMRDEQFPSCQWLLEAGKRNIPFVAGSDAHRPDDVGRYFDRLQNL